MLTISAKLPWWVGVVLAGLSYVGLHIVAVGDITMLATAGAAGGAVVRQVAKALANVFQYVLPIMFLAGALVAALGRRHRGALFGTAAAPGGMSAVAAMSWREFERLIGEAFRRRGYRVAEMGGQGADGGVDVVLTKDGERHLVQCKHWRAMKVGVKVVRELYGVMAAQGAAGGFVVTAGEFTREAHDFALGRNIDLIDGKGLAAMLHGADGAKAPSIAAVNAASPGIVARVPDTESTPLCPKCGKAMVQRIAKQGANAGNAFWGCIGFPQCRGVRAAS